MDVEKRRIGRWTFEALDAAVDSAEDVERFLARLGEYPDKVRTAVKYSLRGTLGVEAHARLQRGLDEYEAVFASLRPRERTMDLYLEPSEEELASLDISGYAAEALHELLDNREDPSPATPPTCYSAWRDSPNAHPPPRTHQRSRH